VPRREARPSCRPPRRPLSSPRARRPSPDDLQSAESRGSTATTAARARGPSPSRALHPSRPSNARRPSADPPSPRTRARKGTTTAPSPIAPRAGPMPFHKVPVVLAPSCTQLRLLCPSAQTPTLTTRPLRRHTTGSPLRTRKGPLLLYQPGRVARQPPHAAPLPLLAKWGLATGSRACPIPTQARLKSVGLPHPSPPTRTSTTCSTCRTCSTLVRSPLTWEMPRKATTILKPLSRTSPNIDLPCLLVALLAMGNVATLRPSSLKTTTGQTSTPHDLAMARLQRPTSST
jgi:hypothetical protein